jgi:hypothetical protein
MCLHWGHAFCHAYREGDEAGKGAEVTGACSLAEFAAHCAAGRAAHTAANFDTCACTAYVQAGIMRLAPSARADAILAAWPWADTGIAAPCLRAAMTAGDVRQLEWLLTRGAAAAAPAFFAEQVAACHARLLCERPRYAPAIMNLVVQHGWCPWASANPGVTLTTLHTATWAARRRFVGVTGVSPEILAFLPLCTAPDCSADHARFDRRVFDACDAEEDAADCGYFSASPEFQ